MMTAYLCGSASLMVKVEPLLKRVSDRGGFLSAGVETEATDRLQRHERAAGGLGGDGFVAGLERMLGRILRPEEPDRKPTPDAK